MFFSNSYFLFGLLFLILPFLINFLTKKQFITVKFPSLLFLKKTLKQESRRLQWQEILLLILRTLALLFLVLALARPSLSVKDGLSGLWLHKDSKKSVVFILDNSYSMGAISEGESVWNRAKRLLIRTARELLTGQDDFCLILSADDVKNRLVQLSTGKNRLIGEIQTAPLSYQPNRIFDALLLAEKLLDGSSRSRRLIILVSDMQKVNFIKEKEYLYPFLKSKYPVILRKPEGRESRNSAVIQSILSVRLNMKNEPGSFFAVVKNFSQARNNLVLRTVRGKEGVGQRGLSLAPFEKTSFPVIYTLNDSGFIPFMTEILDGDDLVLDNRHYTVLLGRDEVRISYLDPHRELLPVLGAVDPSYVVNPATVSALRLREIRDFTALSADDMLILSYTSMKNPQAALAGNLLKQGTGILLFPSRNMDINNFNGVFCRELELDLSLLSRVSPALPCQIEYLDYSHPALFLFRDLKIFQEEKILSYYKISASRMAMNMNVLARFQNGDPAVVELKSLKYPGTHAGRILLFTFLPDRSSTDLIYSPNFPVLIQQAVKYLVTPSGLDQLNRFTVGQPLDDVFSLLGIEAGPVRQIAGEEDFIRENRIVKPGIYRIRDLMFAVNLNYEESDLSALSLDDLKKNYPGLRISFSREETDQKAPFPAGASFRSLSRLFFWIVLFLLVAEMLLRNGMLKQTVSRWSKK